MCTSFHSALASLLALQLLLVPARAQQSAPRQPAPPPQQQEKKDQKPHPEAVIRAFTDIVLIDVQVAGRDGKPVKGLKAEQFTLLENGKEQKISTFDYYDVETVETVSREEQKPIVISLGAVAAPEQVREQVRDHRLVVLFYDLTSMQPDELLRAIEAGQKFLREQMTPADLVAILAFANRLGVIAPFTNQQELLLAQLNRLQPGKDANLAETPAGVAAQGEQGVAEDVNAAFTADETEFNIFNTDRKLAALESVANLLRDIPGKKSLIHFAGGITQTGEDNRSQLRAAVDAANRANVSFYTVDTRGLEASVPGGDARQGGASGTAMYSGAAVFRQGGARQDSRDTLATLATDTGGRSFFDLGDLKEVFEKVQDDTSGYYLLGYYSSDARKDGKWRQVKVRVHAPGIRVQHREGYYAPKEFGVFTAEDRERHLEEAMRAETPRVELPLALETAYFRVGQDELFVPIAAKLASSALEWAKKRGQHEATFDFALEVREERSGRPAAALRDTVKVKLEAERFQQVQQRAIVYQGGVLLGPGHYRIKFLARDNESGRIGTFEQPLELPAARDDRIELSSVLLSSQIEAVRKTSEVEKKALGVEARLKESPLEMGGERIIPSVTRVFTTQQKLYVFFQAYFPAKVDPAKLRAGLVFFRNGERLSETPLVEPAEADAQKRVAGFRISLPLDKLAPGRYTVQAVAIEAGGAHAAFARAYFALRTPPVPRASSE
jgi:VWFA-related protein